MRREVFLTCVLCCTWTGILAARPDRPVNVQLDTCEKGNATIHWTPGSDNNAPIQYFIVQYNTSFNPKQWFNASKVESQNTNVNIILSPYGNYTFRVLASNKIGQSDPSIPTRKVCRTQPYRPYKHPQNVRTIGDRKYNIHIVWTPMPPIQQNGPGFQYILQYKRRGDEDSTTVTLPIDDWRTNSVVYPTADIYRTYEITLKARNSVGEAAMDARTVIGHSGEDIPAIVPTDLHLAHIKATQVDLSWNFDMGVVDQEDTPVRGEFKGFKVQAWQRNLRDTTMREWNITREEVEKDRTGNKIYATIDNLLPYTNLEAQVAVMNNFFVGRPTDIVQFRTDTSLIG